jgi:hypothetical protein
MARKELSKARKQRIREIKWSAWRVQVEKGRGEKACPCPSISLIVNIEVDGVRGYGSGPSSSPLDHLIRQAAQDNAEANATAELFREFHNEVEPAIRSKMKCNPPTCNVHVIPMKPCPSTVGNARLFRPPSQGWFAAHPWLYAGSDALVYEATALCKMSVMVVCM